MTSSGRTLSPQAMQRLVALELLLRRATDGLQAGRHRSAFRGTSAVFAEHREYHRGDDLRLIDWKAFARHDRPIVKRFEQEARLHAHLVLDVSGSMAFPHDAELSKLDHGALILACLAFVLQSQGDAVGTHSIAVGHTQSHAPSVHPEHAQAALALLRTPEENGLKTGLFESLQNIAERAGKRSIVAIASDLLDFDAQALTPIDWLIARDHDVYVFHVLAPTERALDMTEPTRFEGLEGEAFIDADRDIGPAFASTVESWRRDCEASLVRRGVRYVLASTDEPPELCVMRALRKDAS